MLRNVDAIAWWSRARAFKDRECSGALIEERCDIGCWRRADVIEERLGARVGGSLECFALRVGEMANDAAQSDHDLIADEAAILIARSAPQIGDQRGERYAEV